MTAKKKVKKSVSSAKEEEFTKSLPYSAVKVSYQFVSDFVPACAKA